MSRYRGRWDTAQAQQQPRTVRPDSARRCKAVLDQHERLLAPHQRESLVAVVTAYAAGRPITKLVLERAMGVVGHFER